MKEYYQRSLDPNAARDIARGLVLEALVIAEPRVLSSLAKGCHYPRRIRFPSRGVNEGDWPGAPDLEFLRWGHLRDAGSVHPMGFITYGNLVPFRTALVRWITDGRKRRWNLSDNQGQPLDWIANAALETLDYWRLKERLPRKLRWARFDLHCEWSLEASENLQALLNAEFKLFPAIGPSPSQLSARSKRHVETVYRSTAKDLGLEKRSRVSEFYFDWYVMRTFLGLSQRDSGNARTQ